MSDAKLPGGLGESSTVAEVLRAISLPGRTDVFGARGAFAAFAVSRFGSDQRNAKLVAPEQRLHLWVTATNDDARALCRDLNQFVDFSTGTAGAEHALVLPHHESTPYAEVAPDRRTSLDRSLTLGRLASAATVSHLVMPLASLLRRVPPTDALKQRSRVLEIGNNIERAPLLRSWDEGGYIRVPLVEDPGTYGVRGNIIDLFPPGLSLPVRIELDGDTIETMRTFDPESQRTDSDIAQVFVPPIREIPFGENELILFRRKLRDLGDHQELPTRAIKALIEEIEIGRFVTGMDGYLPAFYHQLDSVFDLVRSLDREVQLLWLDPHRTIGEWTAYIEQIELDRSARIDASLPAFPTSELFLTGDELSRELALATNAIFHRFHTASNELGQTFDKTHDVESAVIPKSEPDSDPTGQDPDQQRARTLLGLEYPDPNGMGIEVGTQDLTDLRLALRERRGDKISHKQSDDAGGLTPLKHAIQNWTNLGLRVVLTARTETQAERLAGLLVNYGITCDLQNQRTDLLALPARSVHIRIGEISDGFVHYASGLALVTEDEVFGTKNQRDRVRKKKKKTRGPGALDDLSDLRSGDFLVHADHGVGRFLGIEKRALGQTRLDQLQGREPIVIETLAIEYAGGDRLFLPVTKLHLVERYAAAEGHTPKLDKIGGTTFARTKSRAAKQVREMADELLRLYAERMALKRTPMDPPDSTYAEFEATFPYEETPDQQRAIEDVLSDLMQETPMDRIVCGDVGFGKTEVALRAAFRVAISGKQVAVLCPTTVLAQQHFQNFKARIQQYPIRIEILSRFVSAKDEQITLNRLKSGEVDIVVGTHRLLSKDVHFKDLGLLVVDEEQRFGVTHKERIKKLRTEIDVLTLTATPIPRTLQLAVGGLRDLSLITTPPTDRRAVRTFVARWDDHLLAEAIRRELRRGGQSFFVYNRIEGLYERAAKLTALVPEARIAVVHGQLPESILEETMTRFVAGDFDVLCATAIIESGLDIPRANTIIIDRADAFGLSQLYQLRGRVGRSKERAYCYLLTPPPSTLTDEARARIETLERHSELGSGFKVAALDMEIRGAGDVLGAEQSGNLAAIGFDIFLQMLEEALAELRGEPIQKSVDTEINLEDSVFLPDDYIEDTGLRLSFYKRFSRAEDEDEVVDIASEMEDRFGPLPEVAKAYVRTARWRPQFKHFRILGCEATRERVTFHLDPQTPLDPAKVLARVQEKNSPWRVTEDMKLIHRFPETERGDSLDRVEVVLAHLGAMT